MAQYLVQVSYTPEAWAAFVKNPQDRSKSLEGPLAKLGGKIDHYWMAFGDYDAVSIVTMPDNVSAAALAIAASAGGACKAIKTTPLMSIQEGLEAMKKAASSGYRAVTAG